LKRWRMERGAPHTPGATQIVNKIQELREKQFVRP
jgi:hypothetical protein